MVMLLAGNLRQPKGIADVAPSQSTWPTRWSRVRRHVLSTITLRASFGGFSLRL